MPPVICVVGRSNAGKTTFIEKMVAELTRRGYRVATIKHCSHDLDLDVHGKDSQRHLSAGSQRVALGAPGMLAFLQPREREADLEEIRLLMGQDQDIIIAEGFHNSRAPKIEVYRTGVSEGLISDMETIWAIVTDRPFDLPLPQFTRDDISGVCDNVEEDFLAHRPAEELTIVVNGTPLAASPFVTTFVANTLLGMLSALRGVAGDVRRVDISLIRRS